MKKLFLFSIITLTIFLIVNNSAQAGGEKKFGNEISLTEKTKIADVFSSPEEFLGKKILVEGKVVEVCQMAGCWMNVVGENDQQIRVKVKDGEIVFTQDLIGNTALVEGELYAIELDEEDAKDYLEHMAEDAGKEFDRDSVTGPMTIYQLKGIGAVVSGDFNTKEEVKEKTEK